MRQRRDRGWHDALRQAGLAGRSTPQSRRLLYFALAALIMSSILFLVLIVLPMAAHGR